MSPNGKRRWRKWAKKLRGEDTNKIWPFATGAYLKRHDRQGYAVPRSLWPKNMELPAKPFSPRSLCGMTMGARKRLAFWDAYVPFCEENTDGTPPKSWRRRCMTAIPYDAGLHAAYNEARAKYRIGERLRPCPGCWQCDECLYTYGSFPGGDPRDFEPDPECSTEAEQNLHAADCDRWERGEFVLRKGSGLEWMPAGMYRHRDGSPSKEGWGFVERSSYGLGMWKKNSKSACSGSGVLPARRPK